MMAKKILLLGEFSGLHLNLKKGLEQLGCEVTLASRGDGKKNIYRDIDITLNNKNKILKFFELKNHLKKFQGYEIVQLIHPYAVNKYSILYNNIFKNNKKVFCVAAGDDFYYTNAIYGGFFEKYSPYDEDVSEGVSLPYSSYMDHLLHRYVLKRVSGIIPVMYEYAHSYRKSEFNHKTAKTIPLPIDVDSVVYQENIIKRDKVVFYHGITRSRFKGSQFIVEAMKIAKEKYPNDIEIIISPIKPLKEYLDIIKNVNVIIDQCRSYSYGMNALYSMAMGRIVMSGCEEECLREFGYANSPVINIQPNVNQIVKQIEFLIEQKHRIRELGQRSREFVEREHSHVKVASQFLNTWAQY